ncbi:MAG TPA: hypothetical protein EYH40_00520 [Desulfurococcales archaeon]|nr:hypothetical protein [Desulfurococcales archaeon]
MINGYIDKRLFIIGLLLILFSVTLILVIPLLITANQVNTRYSGIAIVVIGPLPLILSWGDLNLYIPIIVVVLLIIIFILLCTLLSRITLTR